MPISIVNTGTRPSPRESAIAGRAVDSNDVPPAGRSGLAGDDARRGRAPRPRQARCARGSALRGQARAPAPPEAGGRADPGVVPHRRVANRGVRCLVASPGERCRSRSESSNAASRLTRRLHLLTSAQIAGAVEAADRLWATEFISDRRPLESTALGWSYLSAWDTNPTGGRCREEPRRAGVDAIAWAVRGSR